MQRRNKRNIKKFNRLPMTFFLLIVSAVVFCLSSQVWAQIEIGATAPDFKLKALNDETYQLSQFNNKQSHLLLCFVKSDDSTSIDKLQDIITFLEDYQPKESYQIITVVKTKHDEQEIRENFIPLQNNTEVPILILLDEDSKVIENYQIKDFPTILLLRQDLCVRKTYERFTIRKEKSFYQYLSFIFTSRKGSSSSSGCEGGLCPPPEE
ncbi:MAG: peroxiredoxin family protein [Atribacterota bacterium]